MNKLILLAATAALLFASTDAALTATAGASQTLKKGAAVALTGLQGTNFVCWAATASSGSPSASCVDNTSPATDIGAASGCSADSSGNAVSLTWTTNANTKIQVIECDATGNTAVGTAVDITVTETNMAVTGGNTPTLKKGAAVAITGLTGTNFVCWAATASSGTPAASCVDNTSPATDIGAASGCSADSSSNAVSLTWTTNANTKIQVIECDATGNTAVGTAVDITVTEANIAITGGATQTIAAGAALAVTELGSGRHLCWKSGTSASPATCLVAGTATDAGLTGCGAADVASLAWTTVAGTHVSIIQCNAAVAVGSAVATVLTEQIVVASQNITAGSEVTVTGLTTGNHLCWTAGTAAGAATCTAAATATDIGTTGCGALNDAGLAWTNTNNTYIAIKECSGTTTIGVEVDIVLGEVVTTTAAPVAPATTTVSGASSEAAWSTMLTVFAIAMAAFSTL